MSREWDPVLATSANITLEQLRGFETIFKKLDPDGENEINVTKFVRAGLGRATIQLPLSSRDLRKLFAALRQNPTGPGDPAHISLPVTPNEFLMAMAVPPFFRRSHSLNQCDC